MHAENTAALTVYTRLGFTAVADYTEVGFDTAAPDTTAPDITVPDTVAPDTAST